MQYENKGTMNLETERLYLRQFNIDDYSSMLKNWISDPIIQFNYGEPVYETKKSVIELLNNWIQKYEDNSFYRWAIINKENNENIGQIAFCCVYPEIETAEVEYCIAQAYWSKGYATEALREILKYSFERVGFKKIEGFHRIENPYSGNVLQKAEMKIVENVQRYEAEKKFSEGKICYALTREEYLMSSIL